MQAFEAALQVDAAGLGQPDLARGAIEQARTDMPLERRYVLAHGGRGHLKVARGRGKAHVVGNPDEHLHALQPVHAA